MITENDALGGAGSIGAGTQFQTALQVLAVTGLSRAIDGFLAKKYPLTSFNENATVNASGLPTPASAPATEGSAVAGAFAALKNPIVITIGVVLIASIALFVALRR